MMEVVLNRFPQQEAQTAHSIIENNNLASPLIYHFRQGSRGVNLSTNLFAVNIWGEACSGPARNTVLFFCFVVVQNSHFWFLPFAFSQMPHVLNFKNCRLHSRISGILSYIFLIFEQPRSCFVFFFLAFYQTLTGVMVVIMKLWYLSVTRDPLPADRKQCTAIIQDIAKPLTHYINGFPATTWVF